MCPTLKHPQTNQNVAGDARRKANAPLRGAQSWLSAGGVREQRSIRSTSEIGPLLHGIDACLKQFAYSDRDRWLIQMCADEALVNAVKHGNGDDTDMEVRVDCRIDEVSFWIRVEDEGSGFRPEDVPDPRLPENLERPSGRGIFIMRTYMDSVRYNDRGNVVVLHKNRAVADPSGDE